MPVTYDITRQDGYEQSITKLEKDYPVLYYFLKQSEILGKRDFQARIYAVDSMREAVAEEFQSRVATGQYNLMVLPCFAEKYLNDVDLEAYMIEESPTRSLFLRYHW